MWLLATAASSSWGELKIAPAVYTVRIAHKGIVNLSSISRDLDL